MQMSSLSRRSLSTRPHVLRSARPLRSSGFSQQPLQRAARRSYADAAPAPKSKKGFRFLRWTWRLTWLSSLGLAGYVAYSVYELRHPKEQIGPDPSKKTLVILGRSLPNMPLKKP
jgi:NADH:ubiquinone reductase (non-electrogenic)